MCACVCACVRVRVSLTRHRDWSRSRMVHFLNKVVVLHLQTHKHTHTHTHTHTHAHTHTHKQISWDLFLFSYKKILSQHLRRNTTSGNSTIPFKCLAGLRIRSCECTHTHEQLHTYRHKRTQTRTHTPAFAQGPRAARGDGRRAARVIGWWRGRDRVKVRHSSWGYLFFAPLSVIKGKGLSQCVLVHDFLI